MLHGSKSNTEKTISFSDLHGKHDVNKHYALPRIIEETRIVRRSCPD